MSEQDRSFFAPRALVFDLGNVLIPFDFSIGYRGMEALCRQPPEEIVRQLRKSGLARRFETGEIAPKAFVDGLAAELGIRVGFPEFCEIWNSIFLPETLIPDAAIGRLSERHRLVLLSNTNAIHFESIRERYPILRHFHAFTLSYEVGVMKPDPAIYAHAAARAGCAPGECLFIDDLAENVAGAEREGMPAVRFVSFQQLQLDLMSRGIQLD